MMIFYFKNVMNKDVLLTVIIPTYNRAKIK